MNGQSEMKITEFLSKSGQNNNEIIITTSIGTIIIYLQ